MLTLKALPVFILALLVSSPALSEEIRVPEDYPTIKFAVEASVPGDTILIGPGEYQEFDLVSVLPKPPRSFREALTTYQT